MSSTQNVSKKRSCINCPNCFTRLIKIYSHSGIGTNPFKPIENILYCRSCDLIYKNGERIAL